MSIEISPLLDAAWEILQFVINYGWLLSLLIVLLIFIGGLFDIVGDIFRSFKGRLKLGKKVRRHRE